MRPGPPPPVARPGPAVSHQAASHALPTNDDVTKTNLSNIPTQAFEESKHLNEPQADPASEHKVTARLSFDQVISHQTVDGNWTQASQATLAECFTGGAIDDAEVQTSLDSLQLGENRQEVYITLLACFILQSVYSEKRDEWQLIFENAIDYLEEAEVPNPTQLLKKFKLIPN